MTKFIKYCIIFIAILIVVLLVAPHLISLDSYKETIRVKALQATGRDLVINGKIGLTILPKPSVELEDIAISAPIGAVKPHTFEVKQASAALSLSSLLFGKVEISYIDLKHPSINLEVLKDGTKSWEFTSSNSKPAVENSAAVKDENNEEISVEKKTILPFSIGYINVHGGTVNYVTTAGTKTLDNLNALIYLGDLSGPITLQSDFKTLGEPFKIKAELSELSHISPVIADLNAYGQIMHIKGDLDTAAGSFAGHLKLAGNLKPFLDESNKNLPSELFKNYKFNTSLKANDQQIDMHNITLDMGSFSIFGKGEYQTANSSANVNLQLAKSDSAIKFGIYNISNVNRTFNFTTNSLRPFLDAIGFKTKDMPALIDDHLSLQSNIKLDGNRYSLTNISMSSKDVKLLGNFSFAKENSKTDLDYDLKTNNASKLAKAANIKLPFKISDAWLKGKSTINGQSIETATTVSAAKAAISIAGKINYTKAEENNLNFNVSGDNLAQTFKHLEIAPPMNIGRFSIAGAAKGDFTGASEVSLSKANIEINGSNVEFSGKTSHNLKENKPYIIIDIAAQQLNLDHLVGESSKTAGSSSAISAASTSKAASNGRWSKDKIDLSGLKSINGDLSIAIKSLVKGSLVFDNMILKAKLNDGELSINSIHSGLYGGTLEGSGGISSNKDQPISLKANLKNADLKNISSNSHQFKITQGKFNLNLAVNAHGQNQFDLVNSIAGTANFDAQNGKLSGFDLQKAINGLKQIKDLNSILNMLDSSFSGGETTFKTLTGQLSIDHGKAHIKEFIVETDGAKAQAEGDLNLPNYSLDVLSTITIDVKNIPPFGVKFFGALDNPSHKLDTKIMQDYLVKNVLNNVIDNLSKGKTNPKDLVQELIGGGNSAPNANSTDNNAPQKNERKPLEQMLTKGLENLFKKK